MIILGYRNRRPLHEQVVGRFQGLMFNGVLPQGSQFPSVRSLTVEFSINLNTTQRAYGELEWQGYIYSIKGKGNFVADSSRLRAGILGEWKTRFESSVSKGIKIGVTEEGMTEIMERRYRECMAERGEGHD